MFAEYRVASVTLKDGCLEVVKVYPSSTFPFPILPIPLQPAPPRFVKETYVAKDGVIVLESTVESMSPSIPPNLLG